MAEQDCNWEISKENVQPLREGRNLSYLNEALKSDPDLHLELREKKRLFETELRSYTGDDPLDVWYRYIKWTQEYYPACGTDGKLAVLMKNCCKKFKDNPRYKNDERYIETWLNFASKFISDPIEIYKHLYNNKMGVELAMLYEAWAWELERIGNTQMADAVYKDGLRHMACPIEQLRRRYEQFCARVQADGDPEPAPARPSERRVLSSLRGTEGSRATSQRPGVLGPREMPQQNSGGGNFQVFCDADACPALPPQSGEWRTAPTRDTNQENERKPALWTQAKLGKRPNSSHEKRKPMFTVHEDKDIPETPTRRRTEFVDGVLSARKPPRPQNMFTDAADTKPTEVHQYAREKVYLGAEEFQFEELRAARYSQSGPPDRARRAGGDVTERLMFTLEGERRQFEEVRAERYTQRLTENHRKHCSEDEEDDGELQCSPSPLNCTRAVVDVSNYVPDVTAVMNDTVRVASEDPFNDGVRQKFMERAGVSGLPGYTRCGRPLPDVRLHSTLQLGKDCVSVTEKLGKGAFACVYRIETAKKASLSAKIQKDGTPWEFHILRQLHTRLQETPANLCLTAMFMDVFDCFIYDNGSIMTSDLHTQGTLLTLVNVYRQQRRPVPADLLVLVSVELLRLLEGLRAADVIHGDIKPDNIMILDLPTSCDDHAISSGSSRLLRLIDFGRAIDMRCFPAGQRFHATVPTSGFECVEMKTGRPWSYQVDYFGVVATLYVALRGDYMKVFNERDRWRVNAKFARKVPCGDLYDRLYSEVLNIADSASLPDITEYREQLQEHFQRDCASTLTATLLQYRTLADSYRDSHK